MSLCLHCDEKNEKENCTCGNCDSYHDLVCNCEEKKLKSVDLILKKAIDNSNNENIVNHSFKSIQKIKNSVLDELNLPSNLINNYKKKLENYRFVDELQDMREGCFIRWIRWIDGIPKLTNGGIVIGIYIEKNGIHLKCKNKRGNIFQVKQINSLIFQLLTEQEMVLLSALDVLNEN
jgi:hypothetical protein